jgi:hypothetical protein
LFLALRKMHPGWWGMLIGIAVLNLLICCVVLIGPGFTITADLSYADILLLASGLLGFLLTLPRPLAIALFALQILNMFLVWVFVRTPLFAGARLQWPLLTAALVCAAGLAWHFAKAMWEPQPVSPDASPECPLQY